MTKAINLLIAGMAILSSCTLRTSESGTTADSLLQQVDSVVIQPEEMEVDERITEVESTDTLIVFLQSRTEEMIREIQSRLAEYETVSVSYDSYERASDATWYFDSDLNTCYYDATWSMEGTEGQCQLLFKDKEFIGGFESITYGDGSDSFWYIDDADGNFGISRQYREEGEETYFVNQHDFLSKEDEIENNRLNLFQHIREIADSADVGDETVTFYMRTLENYGVDIVITENITMPRKLYDALMK